MTIAVIKPERNNVFNVASNASMYRKVKMKAFCLPSSVVSLPLSCGLLRPSNS